MGTANIARGLLLSHRVNKKLLHFKNALFSASLRFRRRAPMSFIANDEYSLLFFKKTRSRLGIRLRLHKSTALHARQRESDSGHAHSAWQKILSIEVFDTSMAKLTSAFPHESTWNAQNACFKVRDSGDTWLKVIGDHDTIQSPFFIGGSTVYAPLTCIAKRTTSKKSFFVFLLHYVFPILINF